MRRSALAIAAALVSFALVGNLIIWILPWPWNRHWQSPEMWLATPFVLALASLAAAYIAARLAPRAPYAHGLMIAALPFILAYDAIVVREPAWWIACVAASGIVGGLLGTYLAVRHRTSVPLRRAHN